MSLPDLCSFVQLKATLAATSITHVNNPTRAVSGLVALCVKLGTSFRSMRGLNKPMPGAAPSILITVHRQSDTVNVYVMWYIV